MKNIILDLQRQAIHDLSLMRKSEMTLMERIKYEKAMTSLELSKKIISLLPSSNAEF